MKNTNKNVKKMKKNKNLAYGSTGQIVTGAHLGGRPVQSTLTIPKSVNCWMPDRLRTTLRWWISPVVNLSVTNYGQVRYQPTGVFDIDPTVGGASAPGFNELANIYSSYRVTASHCKAEMVSPGISTPVRLILCPTNLDPGATPTGTQIIDLVDQPYAVSKLAALRGGPITSVQQGMTTEKIFGSPMTKYDDNFAALVNAIPVNNWYWVVAYYAPTTIPLTEGGIILNVFIEIEIDFYDRRRAVS